MIKKLIPIALIASALLPVSCSAIIPAPTEIVTEPQSTATASIPATKIRFQKATPVPDSKPVSRTDIVQGTASPFVSTPTPTNPESAALKGLRAAYVFEGNLYIQDGSGPARKLTESGEDWYPSFSDDGKKIVFYRGLIPHELYSVSVDGSEERALITQDVLLNLGYGDSTELRSLAFIPRTHRLLFNTHELDPLNVESKDQNRRGAKQNNDLLILDVDTGEIKPLLPPGAGGNFLVSPDGNLVAIQSDGRIDVVNIDGEIVYRNLVAYSPSQPTVLEPYVYWMPDSSGLLVLLPDKAQYELEGPSTYTVWRYAFNVSAALRVPLDPPVTDAGPFGISPDRNWILYNQFDFGALVSLNIGDLRNNTSQEYGQPCLPQGWSSDNRHFVCEIIGQGLLLGSVSDPPVFIHPGIFLGWGDTSHYLYFDKSIGMVVLGEINGESVRLLHGAPTSSLRNGRNFFTFIFLNLISN